MNYKKYTKSIVIFFLICAILSIFISKLNIPPTPLKPSIENTSFIKGFAEGAVFPTTDNSTVPKNIKIYGSWINSDQSTGKYVTSWYHAQTDFKILVSGYPTLNDNKLSLEVERKDNSRELITYNDKNPSESWTEWMVRLDPSITEFRIIAQDNSTRNRGWLGFSEPYSYSLWMISLTNLLFIFKIVTTVSLIIVLILGPGIIFKSRIEDKSLWKNFIFLIMPGPFLFALSGLIIWLLGGIINPQILSYFIVSLLLMWVVFSIKKIDLTQHFSRRELFVLAIVIITIMTAVGKVSYSQGPVGELYGGMISRTYEVGDRSDSRISYHNIQLIANHISPYEEKGKQYFAPWSFFSRGPLAGLISSPFVILTADKVPFSMPNQTWSPYDLQGFSTYRFVMICLASLSIIAFYSLLSSITTESLAIIGVAFLTLTPFFVHEIYFTWPKLVTSAFVLLSFYLMLKNRMFTSGIAFSVAYLFHPLAATIFPFLIIWLIIIKLKDKKRSLVLSFKSLIKFVGGTFILIIPWILLQGNSLAQSGFLNYFLSSDGVANTSALLWLKSRINSLFNTLIPGYLFLINSNHPAVNSVNGESSNIIHFYFQYWNTLPFGLGIPLFIWIFAHVLKMIKSYPINWAIGVIGPLLALDIYWGAASTGLMRESGHIIFLSFILLFFWSQHKSNQKGLTLFLPFKNKYFLFLRSFEILLMLFLPTFITSAQLYNSEFIWTDIFSLILTIICQTTMIYLLIKLIKNEGTI